MFNYIERGREIGAERLGTVPSLCAGQPAHTPAITLVYTALHPIGTHDTPSDRVQRPAKGAALTSGTLAVPAKAHHRYPFGKHVV